MGYALNAWTPYEDRRLADTVFANGSLSDLAEELGRSLFAIYSRSKRLGLARDRSGKPQPRAPMAAEWRSLHCSLSWRYDPETADAIFAGKHEPTNADIAAWRRLGRTA